MSTEWQIIGGRIRASRQFRKMTGEQLAEKLDIAAESLRHIENGTRRTSLQVMLKAADILDVSLDYLVGRTEGPLERRIRKELEGSGLTQRQEDAIVELAMNSIPTVKKLV